MNISFDKIAFEDLPDEIIHLIGTKVHRKDLFNFKLTSKRINQNVDYSCLSNSDFRNFSKKFEVKIQNLENVKIEKNSIKLFTNYKIIYPIARNMQPNRGSIKSISDHVIGDNFVEFFFPLSLINSDLFRVIKVDLNDKKFIVFYHLNRVYFNVFHNKEKLLIISCHSFKNYINGIYVDIPYFDTEPNFEILTSDKMFSINFKRIEWYPIEIYDVIDNKYNLIYLEYHSGNYFENNLMYMGENIIFKIFSKFMDEFVVHIKDKFTDQELNIFDKFRNNHVSPKDQDYLEISNLCKGLEKMKI